VSTTRFRLHARPLTPILTPIEAVLALVGLRSIAVDALYMFYSADPSRADGDRHHLYKGGSWVDPTTLDTSMGAMVGTMTADGTGGSLSYTPEIVAPTTVEAISVLYTNANVVVPILSLGFNRALTAGERIALAGLITPIATAAGVSPAACSLVTGQEFQQRVLKMKVNTALAGSANDTFILPAAGAGTYAYTVDWGNGSREYVTVNTAQTKDYDATSTFVVKVYGTYRPYFNNEGDKAKLIGLQIGATNHTTLERAFHYCDALTAIVGYAGTSAVANFEWAWSGCASLTSFPLIDTSAGTNFEAAWDSTGLTSFPLIDTSAGTNFLWAWYYCTGLTSFPLIDTSAGTNFNSAWEGCSGLTSFPALDMSSADYEMLGTWVDCSGLTSFGQIILSPDVEILQWTWIGCTSLTSFPVLDTSHVKYFVQTWGGCSGLTSFPALNMVAGTDFAWAWMDCTSMKASFAFLDISKATRITDMLKNCNINDAGTTTNYDNTLIAWAALDLLNGKTLTATNCKYGGDAGSGGQQARTAIATDDSWTFVDGGHI